MEYKLDIEGKELPEDFFEYFEQDGSTLIEYPDHIMKSDYLTRKYWKKREEELFFQFASEEDKKLHIEHLEHARDYTSY